MTYLKVDAKKVERKLETVTIETEEEVIILVAPDRILILILITCTHIYNKDDNISDKTRPKTKSPTDKPTQITTKDPVEEDKTPGQEISAPGDGKSKLFVLEPGKKTANVSEPTPSKVPMTNTEDETPDELKPKTTDKKTTEIKSKPIDKQVKSVSEPPHLNGDDAKPTGETKPGIDIPQIIEDPVDQDTHDTETEEDRAARPRIQDRKGSIRELIPDKRHGFQLMLKVVAFLSSILHSPFCYSPPHQSYFSTHKTLEV